MPGPGPAEHAPRHRRWRTSTARPRRSPTSYRLDHHQDHAVSDDITNPTFVRTDQLHAADAGVLADGQGRARSTSTTASRSPPSRTTSASNWRASSRVTRWRVRRPRAVPAGQQRDHLQLGQALAPSSWARRRRRSPAGVCSFDFRLNTQATADQRTGADHRHLGDGSPPTDPDVRVRLTPAVTTASTSRFRRIHPPRPLRLLRLLTVRLPSEATER